MAQRDRKQENLNLNLPSFYHLTTQIHFTGGSIICNNCQSMNSQLNKQFQINTMNFQNCHFASQWSSLINNIYLIYGEICQHDEQSINKNVFNNNWGE